MESVLTFIGGLGIGSVITTLVNKWLEARTERARWLRDRRHAAYSALAKELLSMSAWSGGAVGMEEGKKVAADAVLLTDEATLADRISADFDAVEEARVRVQKFAAGSEEWKRANGNEYDTLRQAAGEIVEAMRQRVLR